MQLRFINDYKEHCIKEGIEGTFRGLNEFYRDNNEKLNLDGTELYDSTGKTIGDIQDLEPKEIIKILEGENIDSNLCERRR